MLSISIISTGLATTDLSKDYGVYSWFSDHCLFEQPTFYSRRGGGEDIMNHLKSRFDDTGNPQLGLSSCSNKGFL